jgi:ribose 1,5-bisphosphokinase PhnN
MEHNTAAQKERGEIEWMFDRAEAKRDYPGSYFPAKMKAEAALKAWREKYPREAALEVASRLRRQAESLKSKALGALVYDADGSLDAAHQQKRHDDWMAEAQTKLAEAEKLEAENA